MAYNGCMNNCVKTRNLYNFEEIYFRKTRLSKNLSMGSLRKYAKRVWNVFGKNKQFPKIISSRGDLYCGRYMSYYFKNDICLARNQRDIITLVHELTHALGFDNHGKLFVDMEFKILEEIFNMNRGEIELAAGLLGVER